MAKEDTEIEIGCIREMITCIITGAENLSSRFDVPDEFRWYCLGVIDGQKLLLKSLEDECE